MRRVGEEEKPLVCAIMATDRQTELKKFVLQVELITAHAKTIFDGGTGFRIWIFDFFWTGAESRFQTFVMNNFKL